MKYIVTAIFFVLAFSDAKIVLKGNIDTIEQVLTSSEGSFNDKVLISNSGNGWAPSEIYKYGDFHSAVTFMYTTGVGSSKLYMGDESEKGWQYGLVNVAAFVAQSMQETIQYDACDENSWDVPGGKYALSNACGQLGQVYTEYHCSDEEKHMECTVDPNMALKASTNAKWYGAPGPLFCGPKSTYPFTGYWDYSYECNKPWADPPEFCTEYEGQKAGRYDNTSPVPNTGGRSDVEGCCWWGRGVIQTTGVCNFGKLNYFMGARAKAEGRESSYPDIDFCKTPDSICASTDHPELKWIAGFFYWTESVQSYNASGTWDYVSELRKFVDSGMPNPGSDTGFIHAVSGIVNRGCYNPPCGSGELDAGPKRAQNFETVLKAFGLV